MAFPYHGAVFAVALLPLLLAAPARAQDEGSMHVGDATITVGGGPAILTLPDVPSLFTVNAEGAATIDFVSDDFSFSDDFGDEVGWNINGSIEAPMGANKTISLNGFWAHIEDDDSTSCIRPESAASRRRCILFPLVDSPGFQGFSANTISIFADTEREVDQWGGSLEVKTQLTPGVMGVTQAPPRRYVALGADVRGIDQDLDVAITRTGQGIGAVTYTEDLDTRYYGAYVAWGGDIRPFLFKGLWERWGLHSTFMLRGGIYHADTDYNGRLIDNTDNAGRSVTSALALSHDDVAFIGGLVTETSKRIGRRAVLSLKSESEYYSYVPKMAYNQQDATLGTGGQVGTVINDDDAYSFRTSLRLTIGLGPRDLYR